MLVAAFSLLVATLLSLIFPWIIRNLVDSVFVHHDANTLNLITLGLFGVFIGQAAFNFVQNYLIAWIGERIVVDLRRDLYRHLQTLPPDFYADRRTGELLSRITNDVNAVQNTVSNNLLNLMQEVVTLVGSMAIIFYLDWRLSLLLLVVAPLIAFSAALFGRALNRTSRKVQEGLGDATAVLEETIANMRVVQAFTRERYELGRFGDLLEHVFALTLTRIRIRAAFVATITFLAFAAITSVLWFGGHEVLDGRLTPGGLISFLFYIFLVAGPLGSLTNIYGQAQEAMGAATRIYEVLDTQPTIVDAPDARSLPPLRERLRFEAVSFGYLPDRPVLREVSFEVEAGRMVALVGPSGAGKTTVASLIPRFYEVTSGAITVDGTDIRRASLASLREQIAVVPQEPVLFGISIRDNIGDLPEGYDTLVGERGVKLSGGQRQRIAIARAVLRDPRILILDEATSSLDTESERLVQDALERLMAGRTTLVIAHRLSTIRRADRILVLEAGRIVEEGTHQDLLAIEGLYHRLYTLAVREGGLLQELDLSSEPIAEAATV